MTKSDKDYYINYYLNNPITSKYLKIASIIFVSVISIYGLGHLFKISAHTIRGYNELKKSISDGKYNI